MGRKSDYANMHEKGSGETCTFDQIKDKFGREPMSTAEFAVYLSEVSGVHIDEKTVKNRIKAICEDSDGALSSNDFRKNASDRRSKYELKPKYHATLLTLINTDYFDGRKNDRRISTRTALYKQLASNIEKYLPEKEKAEVTSNPAYVNAMLEGFLSQHMSSELSSLMRSMYHMDSALRYQAMIHFLNILMPFRKWIESMDSKAMAVRMVYAHTMDERHDAVYQKGMFESTTLDGFLIHYLALQVHDEKYEYLLDDETFSMPALFLASIIFHVDTYKNPSVTEMLQQIEARLENHPRYQELTEKAERIFDLNNPAELEIFITLKQLIKIQYLRPEVTPEAYERMVRFTESSIAEDKWDLMNKLIQIGRKNMSREDLDAIVAFINKDKQRKNS